MVAAAENGVIGNNNALPWYLGGADLDGHVDMR